MMKQTAMVCNIFVERKKRSVEIRVRTAEHLVPVRLWCPQYEGSVEENAVHVEAIRIKAVDKDQIYTENWEAVYTIISGNEVGHFNIITDPKTNEGIIIVAKVSWRIVQNRHHRLNRDIENISNFTFLCGAAS